MTNDTYDSHSPFIEYVQAGWALTSIEPRTKGPRVKGWNERKNAITDPAQAGRLAGAGLLHAYSGTCALDVDDFTGATAWLAARGIDLEALLLAEDAVQIRSGVGNRAKLLYALAEPLRSVQVKGADGAVLFELRCGANGGLSVQDVLPPSLHPSGSRYAWAGSGSWDAVPPLPEPLRVIWHELLQPTAGGAAGHAKPASPTATVRLSKEQLQALREAVFFLEAESYEDWTNVGLALAELGDQGRGLWLAWSATSDKFDPTAAAKKWATFNGAHSHWRSVLKMAAARGWVNAGAGAARGGTPAGGEAGGGEEEPDEHTGTGGGEEEPPELNIPAGLAVPEVPARLLPGWLGRMAAAVSKDTQTPEDAAVMLALAMLATACHRRWEVEVRSGYVEILSLWMMVVMPSGSRKSAVVDYLKAPLTLWEKQARDRIRDEQARVQAKIAVSEKRLEALKKGAVKATDAAKRRALEDEIEAEIKAMPEPLVAPRLYTTDITHERYQQLLVEQGERISVITDEGGVFATLAGVYSGGNASIDAFLQGYSGTALRVDRGSRVAHVDRPALSFGVALQPGILADIGKNKRFRDSGLLARFLFAVPLSNVGERDVRAQHPIPEGVSIEYQEAIMTLLDRRTDRERPERLRLSPEAHEALLTFADSVERRMGAGKELDHISEWLAKLPGQAARIAGLLHLATTLGADEAGVISVEAMRRAVTLAERAITHACAAFNLMGVTAAEEDAAAVLKWLRINKVREFRVRHVQRGMKGRFPNKAKAENAIDVLREWQVVLGEFRQGPGAAGGRPTMAYKVNPRLFA